MICTHLLIAYNIEEANRVIEEYRRVGGTPRHWMGGSVNERILDLAVEVWHQITLNRDDGHHENLELYQEVYSHFIHLRNSVK